MLYLLTGLLDARFNGLDVLLLVIAGALAGLVLYAQAREREANDPDFDADAA